MVSLRHHHATGDIENQPSDPRTLVGHAKQGRAPSAVSSKPYDTSRSANVTRAVLRSLVTTRAAPNIFMLRHPASEEAVLAAAFDRFAAWHTARTILQVLNFLTLVWALIADVNHH